ncbi:hypothetical protein BH23PLA1_BH23PLA1_36920 [soil metagenome]
MSSEHSTRPERHPLEPADDPYQTSSQVEAIPSPALRDRGEAGAEGPERIGRFEVLRELGSGGMGIVLLARDPLAEGRLVAIKVLKPALAGNPQSLAWFLKEARHMQRLDHPHLLPVLEVSDDREGPYYVMPYLERGPLSRLLGKNRPLDPETCLCVSMELAQALAHAHSLGLIHRDLKPDNLLIDDDGGVRLADFGLVRSLSDDSILDVRPPQCVGTAPYMSPGVAAGEAEDTRCDIYSFGAVLYEMLAGRRPYRGATSESVLIQILEGPPTPIRSIIPDAPDGLVAIAEGAMARALRDRYASMADVIADLDRVRQGQPPTGPRDRSPAASIVKGPSSTHRSQPMSHSPKLDERPVGNFSTGSFLTLTLVVVLGTFAVGGWYVLSPSPPAPVPGQSIESIGEGTVNLIATGNQGTIHVGDPETPKTLLEIKKQQEDIEEARRNRDEELKKQLELDRQRQEDQERREEERRLREEQDRRQREQEEEQRRVQEAEEKRLEQIRMAEEAWEREYRDAVAREEAEIDELKAGVPEIMIAPLEMRVSGELPSHFSLNDQRRAETHYCLGRYYIDLRQNDKAIANLIEAQEYYKRCDKPHMVRRAGEFLEKLGVPQGDPENP